MPERSADADLTPTELRQRLPELQAGYREAFAGARPTVHDFAFVRARLADFLDRFRNRQNP